MRVYVCALAKNEHIYINEWVRHYYNLGVDKIFIFDNDEPKMPEIKGFIGKKYLDKVRVINARGKNWKGMQHDFYTNFYNIEKDNFDWCLFCDIDEFLTGTNNIKEFLSNPIYRNFVQIRIKWKLFGDDNQITRDMTKPIMKCFTKEITKSLTNDLKGPSTLERQGKAIVRGHLKNVIFNSVHFATNKIYMKMLKSCLPSGANCFSGVAIYEDYSNETIFLNHYMTKSLSEFVKQKMNRTDAVFGGRHLNMNYYWRINEKTQEKIEYIKSMGLE